jgi:hypothetical protein
MSEQEAVRGFLGSLEVGEPRCFEGLALYPIRRSASVSFACLTLDEAIARGTLHVGEVGTGRVPELLLSNEGDERVFLLDGEELVGAMQNRILNTSLLVERHSRLTAPVSCVEHGRWQYRAARAMRPGSVSHPGLRSEKAAQVHENLHAHGAYAADQPKIWRNVEHKLSSLGADSPSEALAAGFVHHRRSLERYAAHLPCPEGAIGVAAAIAGRLACADLFATPTLLARLWEKLVASYALDAIDAQDGPAGHAAAAEVTRMLGLPDDAVLEAFPAPGLGSDVRLRSARASGSALVVEGVVVHAELFAPVALE